MCVLPVQSNGVHDTFSYTIDRGRLYTNNLSHEAKPSLQLL